MNQNFIKKLLPLCISVAMVSACDSGGSKTSSGASTTQSKTVNGRVTGFGSVIVGGVHFDVGGAVMTHDGRAIAESDLKAGMVVRLTGSVNQAAATGVATALHFDEQLKGSVSSVNAAGDSFVALGQTILVDEETVFHGVTLDTLTVDSSVLVSGYFDASGDLRASLVELKSTATETSEEVEVDGIIQALDANNQTFMLRGQLVGYTSAELSGVPEDTLSNGMFVEVMSTQAISGGMLTAEKIKYEEDDANEAEGDRLELEGLVTEITSSTQFKVNGRSVILADAAVFDVGSAADITLNTRIKVEGELNAQGVLVAEEAKLRRRGRLLIDATVDAVNAEANTMVVMGVEVTTTATTVWKDDSDENERYLSLSRLGSGDRVEVKGYQKASGEFVATSVEREDADQEAVYRVRGPIADLANMPNFTLFGITVSTDITTEFETSSSVTLTQFFSGVAEGTIVEVEGTVTGSSEIKARSVEVEEQDNRDEFGGDKESSGA